jgi:hypothetical protein
MLLTIYQQNALRLAMKNMEGDPYELNVSQALEVERMRRAAPSIDPKAAPALLKQALRLTMINRKVLAQLAPDKPPILLP